MSTRWAGTKFKIDKTPEIERIEMKSIIIMYSTFLEFVNISFLMLEFFYTHNSYKEEKYYNINSFEQLAWPDPFPGIESNCCRLPTTADELVYHE